MLRRRDGHHRDDDDPQADFRHPGRGILGVHNARREGLNCLVWLTANRAYRFHMANAAFRPMLLCLGVIEHVLSHD
jgi:hypothetical protein